MEPPPIQRHSDLRCSVITTKCHQLSSVSVSLLCSKCLLYVDYVFQGKVSWYFMSYQVSPYLSRRKSRLMRPSVLRRGDLCGISASLSISVIVI